MQFSEMGELAQQYWMEIPQHFPFVVLDAFVVMPNHVHGIIVINKMDDGRGGCYSGCRDAINRVSTGTNNPKTGGITGINNPMLTENLSKIIRWYKGRVSYELRKIHADFAWQSRFHDHIIRNNESFQRISNLLSITHKIGTQINSTTTKIYNHSARTNIRK